jgi:hypothetical protein
MGGRSRIRRALKWSGTGACGLVLALWVVSVLGVFSYQGDHWGVCAQCGTVENWWSGKDWDIDWPWRGWGAVRRRCWPRSLLESAGLVWPRFSPAPLQEILVPFWSLLLVVLVPTGFLWYGDDRRIPPGHCRTCGYNLTGNVSGRCPECGTAIGAA